MVQSPGCVNGGQNTCNQAGLAACRASYSNLLSSALHATLHLLHCRQGLLWTGAHGTPECLGQCVQICCLPTMQRCNARPGLPFPVRWQWDGVPQTSCTQGRNSGVHATTGAANHKLITMWGRWQYCKPGLLPCSPHSREAVLARIALFPNRLMGQV